MSRELPTVELNIREKGTMIQTIWSVGFVSEEFMGKSVELS